MERAREDDPELEELRGVMAEWLQLFGLNSEMTAKAAVHEAEQRRVHEDTGHPLPGYRHPGLRDALLAVAGIRGAVDTGRLGKWLRAKKGRIVTVTHLDKPIRVRLEPHGVTDGSARWRLALAQ